MTATAFIFLVKLEVCIVLLHSCKGNQVKWRWHSSCKLIVVHASHSLLKVCKRLHNSQFTTAKEETWPPQAFQYRILYVRPIWRNAIKHWRVSSKHYWDWKLEPAGSEVHGQTDRQTVFLMLWGFSWLQIIRDMMTKKFSTLSPPFFTGSSYFPCTTPTFSL